jgi:hypothetical protein
MTRIGKYENESREGPQGYPRRTFPSTPQLNIVCAIDLQNGSVIIQGRLTFVPEASGDLLGQLIRTHRRVA